jgi:multisubunit Na+/H+ antiporter MnhE subunit
MRERAIWWSLTFIAVFAFWMLCVYSLAWHEAASGLAAAVLAATFSERARGRERARFWPHFRWLMEFWRVPPDILRGCATLAGALLRGGRGTLRLAPFEFGGRDPSSAARRAIAITFASIDPSSIVIGIDEKSNRLLVHLAAPAPVPRIARELGART